MSRPRVIIALDFPSSNSALDLVQRLDPTSCRLKIGKELFTRAGPNLLEKLHSYGFSVFLDLKFHDIPNTVAGACRAAAELGVWMLNVHALGGTRMLAAAREAIDKTAQRPILIAVTVLTSHSADDLAEIGITEPAEQLATRLARLTQSAGLDGVVCSAQEAPVLRQHCGENFCLVTPGIRLSSDSTDDQRRIMTPRAAIQAGADYLVIGRPITQAADPAAVVQRIHQDLQDSSHA